MRCRRCGRYHRRQWHPRGQLAPRADWLDDDEPECDDEGLASDWHPEVDCSELCDYEARGDFHVGDEHDGRGAETLVCKVCGCDRWLVGSVRGDYRTLAKCCGCGYEATVHEG